jgi:hypothetical protein
MRIVTDFDMFRINYLSLLINLFHAQYSERLDYVQQENRRPLSESVEHELCKVTVKYAYSQSVSERDAQIDRKEV